MKSSATELMKNLNGVEEEIRLIHNEDLEESSVLLNSETGNPLYVSKYDFMANRQKINELRAEERKIKALLAKFNYETKVIGYDFNINEGLVRLGQLKDNIKVLLTLSRKSEVFSSGRTYDGSQQLNKVCYSIEEARKVLKETQKELSALQVAIDRTNLTSVIEY